jgi:hypothetical protein
MRSACLVSVLLAVLAASAAAQTRVFDIVVSGPIAEVPVSLSARQAGHAIQLKNVQAGAAPVMEIVAERGGEVPGVVRRGDLPVIGLPGQSHGTYRLIIYDRLSEAPRTADVWVDGAIAVPHVVFSRGARLALPAMAAGETAIAVAPPGGLNTHTAFLLNAGGHIVRQASGPITRLTAQSPGDAVVLYGTTAFGASGKLRVFRNDVLTDADGDGVGDGLEAALETCASASASVPGIACATVADARDTDGDGLWDSWEAFGVFPSNGTEYVPLQMWGANPRHKDIFVEVDFRRLTLSDNQNGLAEHMTPMVARQMAGIYGDAATTDAALRTQHAQDAGNPDGLPGVSLHLDTGVAPETPSDLTIFGDWGGYSAVDAVNDGMGNYNPQTPGGAMATNFNPVRRGLFHYVLGYTSGGGACGVGIACGFNMADAGNSSHEFGHTLFLDHNGPAGTHEPNCKPNYPSLMNYAYIDSGYRLFSDGHGLPPLNNHSLPESGAVSPSETTYLDTLKNTFRYRVDMAAGSVDWNRDGQFSPAGTTVRAYANYRPYDYGGCEFTREGEVPVGTKSDRSPAVLRYNGLIWLFTVNLNHELEYTYTASPWTCQNTDDCPPPEFPYHVLRNIGPVEGVDAAAINVNGAWVIIVVGIRPDGTIFETWMRMAGWLIVWESTVTVPASPAAGEPSLAVSQDGRSVALAYRGTDNIVRYRTRTTATWRPEEQIVVGGHPLEMSPNASPGLVFAGLPIGMTVGQEHVMAAVADTNGWIQLYTREGFPHPGWTSLGIPYEGMYSPIGRPAMAWTGTAPANALAAGAGAASATSTTVGRFYLVYLEYNPPVAEVTNPNPTRMAMSYVDTSGTLRIGLGSYFDNVWSYAFGIDLLQPGEVGLRAAVTYSIPNAGSHPDSLYQVRFRPHADGISDLPYSNKNDWPVIAWGSCAVLAAQQPPPMKTTCAPRPW